MITRYPALMSAGWGRVAPSCPALEVRGIEEDGESGLSGGYSDDGSRLPCFHPSCYVGVKKL
jgi:hypothetical protein